MYDVSGTAVRASQISSAIETLQLDTHGKSPCGGDTLISQYKHCSTVNEQKLREAKNIKELVKINVSTVNKALFTRIRGKTSDGTSIDETSYNMQFDPINFMQKVPCMGDRDFLVNQSILHNSSCSNRVSEAFNRQKFIRQTRGSIPSNARTQQNYWTQTQQQPDQASVSKPKGNSGLRNLLPELPNNGIKMRKPRQSLHSYQTMRANKKSRTSINANSLNDTQDRTVASDRENTVEVEFDNSANMDNRGSQIDPVRCLQKIFRKHEKQERNPGVNLIAEKYKKEAHSAKSERRSRMIGTANTFMTSGAFNLNPDGFGQTVRQLANNFPQTPATTGNFFNKMDTRGSYGPQTKPENILLKREVSRGMPPATAPMGMSRPEVVARLNTDLEPTASQALMPHKNYQKRAMEKRDAVTANAGGRLQASFSSATPNDSKLGSAPSPAQIGFQSGKRSTLPIMIEQTTQLDKPSNIASSSLELSSVNPYLLAIPITDVNVQLKTQAVPASTHRASDTQNLTAMQQQYQHALQTQRAPPDVSPFVNEELSQAQLAIRSRLAKMKQLFDQEEEIDKIDTVIRTGTHVSDARPDSSDWDLHRHKLEYEQTIKKRQQFMDMEKAKRQSYGLKGETPLGFNEDQTTSKKQKKRKAKKQFDMQEDELKDFLMYRIAELKRLDDDKLEDLQDVKFKFRASTISNVLPSGNLNEQTRLAANYKNRFKNKGEKLHQRMLNSQQRLFQQRDSEQRKSHHQDIILARKEIISNRSKGSQLNSPMQTYSGPIEQAVSSCSDSKDTMEKLRQSKKRQIGLRQINTDIGNDVSRQVANDTGLSTQKASASFTASKLTRAPKTPQGLSYSKTADQEPVTINDCLSEKAGSTLSMKNLMEQEGEVVIEQKLGEGSPFEVTSYDQTLSKKLVSHSQLLRKPLENAPQEPQILFDSEPAVPEGEEDDPPNTAIIFCVDDQKLTGAKKINYFTSILRQIEMIDRNWEKEQRRRRMGLRHEALKLVKEAVQKQTPRATASSGFTPYTSNEDAKGYMDIEDAESSVSTDQENELELEKGMAKLKRLGIMQTCLKDDTIKEETTEEINRQPSPIETAHRLSSIQHQKEKSAMKPIEKNSGRTSDLIILKVAGEPCQIVEQQSRSKQSSPTNEHKKPMVYGAAACKRHSSTLSDVSRIKAAENGIHSQDQACLRQHRSSVGTASLEPTTSNNQHKFVIMQSQTKFSQSKLPLGNDSLGGAHDPKTVSRQSKQHSSQHSLKRNSVEVYEQKVPFLNSDNNGTIYDAQHTYSVKLSAHDDAYMRATPQRQGSSDEGGIDAQYDPLVRASRTLTARMDSQPKHGETNQERTLNQTHSLVTGSQLAYFCPKRFNRFPRFTIFFKKGQQNEEGSFVSENTVSLNADFLKFLSDKRSSQVTSTTKADGVKVYNQKIETGRSTDKERKSLLSQSVTRHNNADTSQLTSPASQILGGQQDIDGSKTAFSPEDIEQAEQAASDYLPRVPIEVEQWNDYLKAKNFDPFDRVVLVKGIDNSILTSFRTLKGENNTVSDTFKIVHRKFQPSRTGNSFFKNIQNKHNDKMLYQTQNQQFMGETIAEEDFEYSRMMKVANELQDSVTLHGESQFKHLEVDPAFESKQRSPNSHDDEMSEGKLKHAMTAALIEIEKTSGNTQNNGISTPPGGRMASSSRGAEKKSPFRVITTLDKMNIPSDSNFIRETKNSHVAQGRRMPKPKPLNMITSKRKHSHAVASVRSNKNKLGIMGTTPNYAGQQQLELDHNQFDWGNTKYSQNNMNGYRGSTFKTSSAQSNNPYKILNPNANSQLNTQYHSAQNTIVESGHPADSYYKLMEQDTEKRDIKLIMQPNFQFNSMGAVELSNHDGQALSKQVSSANQNQSTDNAFGITGVSAARAKSRNTDICTEINNPQFTSMSQDKCNNNVSRHEKSVPKSTVNLDAHQNGSPTLLNINKLNIDRSSAQKPIPPTIQGSQNEIISSTGNENQNQLASGGIEQFGLMMKDVDTESAKHLNNVYSMDEFSSQYQPVAVVQASMMSPPLVAVIRSNTQFNQKNGSPQNTDRRSMNSQSPQPQKSQHQTTEAPDEQAEGTLTEIDYVGGAPKIHNAMTLTVKMTKPKAKNQFDNNQSIHSTAASPRGLGSLHMPVNLTTEGTEQSGLASWRKASEHVGVLQVPDSIKAIHSLNSYFAVEQMAMQSNSNKKGAVSGMIDRIYQRDRKMVNNLCKGNMLNTAVLTDMNRYHKLKSQTGVEKQNYDDDWLQERIEEEMGDPGLSLDFAPDLKSSQVKILPQNFQLMMHSNHVNSPESPTAARDKPIVASEVECPTTNAPIGKIKKVPVPMTATEKVIRKSLEGTLKAMTLKSDGIDGQDGPTNTANRDSCADYCEIINRSDHGTGLEKSNYN